MSYASAVGAVSATATRAHRLPRGPNSDIQLCHTFNLNGDGNGGLRRGWGLLQET